MTANVVLVSRDPEMSAVRAHAIREAGYRPVHIRNLLMLEPLCRFKTFRTLVLDDTVNVEQRRAIVQGLMSQPIPYRVICIDRSTSLMSLVHMCHDSADGGDSLVDTTLPAAS